MIINTSNNDTTNYYTRGDVLRLPLKVSQGTQLDPTPSNYIQSIQFGWRKCKNLLNTHKTELIHCNLN